MATHGCARISSGTIMDISRDAQKEENNKKTDGYRIYKTVPHGYQILLWTILHL